MQIHILNNELIETDIMPAINGMVTSISLLPQIISRSLYNMHLDEFKEDSFVNPINKRFNCIKQISKNFKGFYADKNTTIFDSSKIKNN